MGLFSNKKKRDYSIIAGCGRLGANLACALYDRGTNVLIIDSNEEAFGKLSPSFGGLTYVGDAMEIFVLDEADIKNATVVAAVTNNDNTNILIAQLAKELFHLPHVIARLHDPEKECVYRELGIDTIFPGVLSAKEVDRILNIGYQTEEEV